MSELHGGGKAAAQAADAQKHFTKNAFFFCFWEGKKKKKGKQLRQQQQKQHIRHALLV